MMTIVLGVFFGLCLFWLLFAMTKSAKVRTTVFALLLMCCAGVSALIQHYESMTFFILATAATIGIYRMFKEDQGIDKESVS